MWFSIASFVTIAGFIVCGWPAIIVECMHANVTQDWMLFAYWSLLAIAPLYTMLVARSYPLRESWPFFLQRLCECLQYSFLHAAWILWVNPLPTFTHWMETFELIIWSRAIPMLIGLNFTWLDKTPLRKVSFSYHGWKRAPWLNMLVAFFLMLVVCAQIWIVTQTNGLDKIVESIVITLVIGTLVQEALRMVTMKQSALHIHHYYVGLVCGAMCWGSHEYSIFLSHVFWGVYVEGVAAWGRDPVYLESS